MTASPTLPSDFISFTPGHAALEVSDAVSRLCAALRKTGDDASVAHESLGASVREVESLDVALLLSASVEADAVADTLFHIASALASANPTAAWQGLLPVPAGVALHDLPEYEGLAATMLALPGTGRALWSPVPLWPLSGEVLSIEADALLGPLVLSAQAPSSVLPGFAHGRLARFDPPDHGTGRRQLRPTAQQRLRELSTTLLAGLLDGAVRRIAEEAYAYAASRQSFGKPISQHQAVMLRLADIALDQQSLSLYLQGFAQSAARFEPKVSTCGMNTGHISDCAARIARDSLQIAAAHGYVEGLPFKRLFEQIRTIDAALVQTIRLSVP